MKILRLNHIHFYRKSHEHLSAKYRVVHIAVLGKYGNHKGRDLIGSLEIQGNYTIVRRTEERFEGKRGSKIFPHRNFLSLQLERYGLIFRKCICRLIDGIGPHRPEQGLLRTSITDHNHLVNRLKENIPVQVTVIVHIKRITHHRSISVSIDSGDNAGTHMGNRDSRTLHP